MTIARPSGIPGASRTRAPNREVKGGLMAGEQVLVVDDEPDMVENLTRILRREGYRCLSSTDARKAVELVEKQRPDLLVKDLKMAVVVGMVSLGRVNQDEVACG